MSQTTDYGYICMLAKIVNTTPEEIIFSVYQTNGNPIGPVDTVIAHYLVTLFPPTTLSDKQQTLLLALKKIAKQKLSTKNT